MTKSSREVLTIVFAPAVLAVLKRQPSVGVQRSAMRRRMALLLSGNGEIGVR